MNPADSGTTDPTTAGGTSPAATDRAEATSAGPRNPAGPSAPADPTGGAGGRATTAGSAASGDAADQGSDGAVDLADPSGPVDPSPGTPTSHRSRVRRWLHDTLWGRETAARLVTVHVGLSALIGVRIVAGSYRQLADTPTALVDPVPFLAWLDRMPSAQVFVALQVAGGLAALAAVLRRHTRWTFALAWLCYLVLAGLRGSRGKVLHNDLLLLWASAPFLLAPVAVDLRDRIARRGYGWPIRVATLITVLVYLFAGYHKLRRSGFDWVTGDNMSFVMLWGPSIGDTPWESATRWVGEHVWAGRATAAGILGVELTIPLVLVWRRLKPWYALAAVALHVGTWVLLGLDYWAWAITVPLLFVDWPAVAERVRSRRSTAPGSTPTADVAG